MFIPFSPLEKKTVRKFSAKFKLQLKKLTMCKLLNSCRQKQCPKLVKEKDIKRNCLRHVQIRNVIGCS